MNEDTSFCHQPASRHGIGGPDEARKTTSPGMNDMTGLILAAIAAALLAGLLVLPVTMPGTARIWAKADLPAPFGPETMVTRTMSVRS
ncbi:hypothetical protein [Tateyamaria pelophila]|uniref:hypothetical protein n=1 Tax=Tateyamaria pelophila TaxID=328415 RepID=UPI001CBEE75C|nr:hypothetical protein [Tateyamaria pelophila]